MTEVGSFNIDSRIVTLSFWVEQFSFHLVIVRNTHLYAQYYFKPCLQTMSKKLLFWNFLFTVFIFPFEGAWALLFMQVINSKCHWLGGCLIKFVLKAVIRFKNYLDGKFLLFIFPKWYCKDVYYFIPSVVNTRYGLLK